MIKIRYHNILIIFLPVLINSCQTLKQSSKYGFNEGFYKSRIFHKKLKKVYVVPENESIKIYTEKSLHKHIIDTVTSLKIVFPSNQKPREFENYLFRQNSLDLDILTILFKYRPSVS